MIRFSRALRQSLAQASLPALVGVQVYRVLGLEFVILTALGQLPGRFGLPAGWGDVAIGLSTSGNSGNVLAALSAASELGLTTIGFTGGDGGAMAGGVDYAVIVPADSTPRIQEGHLLCAHILCEIVERTLFD